MQPASVTPGVIGEVLLRGADCPRADPNPAWTLDSTNQPQRRSFAMLAYNQDRRLDDAWEWLFAESKFTTILGRDDLAGNRHVPIVNVFFRDSHMERLPVSKVSFPAP